MVILNITNAVMIIGGVIMALPMLALAVDWYYTLRSQTKNTLSDEQRNQAIRVVNAGAVIAFTGLITKIIIHIAMSIS